MNGPFTGRKPNFLCTRQSIAVDKAFDALMLGAMDAAIDRVVVLHAMADNAAVAMRADGGERGDGAFKAVEHVRPTSHEHLKGLIVLVAAYFTLCHHMIPFL